MAIEKIIIEQPFNLAITLECGQGHRCLKEIDNHWYQDMINGHNVRMRQTQVGHVRNIVEVDSGLDRAVVEKLLRRRFRLDDRIGIERIYRDLSGRDDTMADLVKKYWGLRVMRVDPWGGLVFFVRATSASIKSTQTTIENIAAVYSNQPRWDRKSSARKARDRTARRPFPNPCAIVHDPSRLGLAGLGMGLKGKGTRILGAACCFWSHVPNLDLKALFGVGDKVSDCVDLFSREKLSAFPRDRHILEKLKTSYSGVTGFPDDVKNPYDQRLSDWVQSHFGVYGGYASQFLFIDDLLKGQPARGKHLGTVS